MLEAIGEAAGVVLVLSGAATEQNLEGRIDGIEAAFSQATATLEIMRENNDATIVSAVERALAEHGDALLGVITLNGTYGPIVAEHAVTRGLTGLRIVAWDLSAAAQPSVEDGTIQTVLAQRSFFYGYLPTQINHTIATLGLPGVVSLLSDHATGPDADLIDTGMDRITRDNLGAYLFHGVLQDRKLTVTSGLAYTLLRDSVAFSQLGLNLAALDLSSARTLSWESDVRLRLGDAIAYAVATLQATERAHADAGYRAQLLGDGGAVFPGTLLQGGLSLEPGDWQVAAEVVQAGPRASSDDNTLVAGTRYVLPPYATLDLRIAWRGLCVLQPHPLQLELQARTLLGHQVAAPGQGGVDCPPAARTLWLRATQPIGRGPDPGGWAEGER